MLSDRIIIAARKTRGGVWVPEDRLQAALLGAGLLAPCSTLIVGIILQFMHNTAGLVLVCIFFFINGVGVSDFVDCIMKTFDIT